MDAILKKAEEHREKQEDTAVVAELQSAPPANRGQQDSMHVGGGQQDSMRVGGGEQDSMRVGGGQQDSMLVGGGEQDSMLVRGGEQGSMLVGGGEQGSMLVGGGEQGSMLVGGGEQDSMLVAEGKQGSTLVGGGEQICTLLPGGKESPLLLNEADAASESVGGSCLHPQVGAIDLQDALDQLLGGDATVDQDGRLVELEGEEIAEQHSPHHHYSSEVNGFKLAEEGNLQKVATPEHHSSAQTPEGDLPSEAVANPAIPLTLLPSVSDARGSVVSASPSAEAYSAVEPISPHQEDVHVVLDSFPLPTQETCGGAAMQTAPAVPAPDAGGEEGEGSGEWASMAADPGTSSTETEHRPSGPHSSVGGHQSKEDGTLWLNNVEADMACSISSPTLMEWRQSLSLGTCSLLQESRQLIQDIRSSRTRGLASGTSGSACVDSTLNVEDQSTLAIAENLEIFIRNDMEKQLTLPPLAPQSSGSSDVCQKEGRGEEAAIFSQQERGGEEAAVVSQQEGGGEEATVVSQQERGGEEATVVSQQERGGEEIAVVSQQERGGEEVAGVSQQEEGGGKSAGVFQQEGEGEEVTVNRPLPPAKRRMVQTAAGWQSARKSSKLQFGSSSSMCMPGERQKQGRAKSRHKSLTEFWQPDSAKKKKLDFLVTQSAVSVAHPSTTSRITANTHGASTPDGRQTTPAVSPALHTFNRQASLQNPRESVTEDRHKQGLGGKCSAVVPASPVSRRQYSIVASGLRKTQMVCPLTHSCSSTWGSM